MDDSQVGNMLTNVAVAIFAGALGSVLTLAATNRLVPTLADTSGSETVAPSYPAQHERPGIDEQVEKTLERPSMGPLPAELQQSLNDAAEERSQLSATLVTLTRQIDDLEADLINLNARNTLQVEDQANSHASEAMPVSGEYSRVRRRGGPDRSEIRIENLVSAGLDEQTAVELQHRSDQYQLSRLELFDQAAREGWSESTQMEERLAALDEMRVDLRKELGDAAYDRYLFDSGRSNRVGIESIISGSAAEQAGLQIGDLILNYAGERIFRVPDLQEATRQGSRGEYVLVVFDRGGQSMSTDITRGPLGVTLVRARVEP